MFRINTLGLIGVGLVLSLGASAQAGFQYVLEFGTAGAGTSSLTGTGVVHHGVTSGAPVRFFDGAGTQATAAQDIPYINASFDSTASDIVPNRPPALGSAMPASRHGFLDTTFDGTALWLRNSSFPAGTAPATGNDGSDIRPENGFFHVVPVVTNKTTVSSTMMQMDVFIPSHTADLDTTSNDRDGLIVSPYIDREGFGGTSPGGHSGALRTFSNDVWHLLQIFTTITTNGGATAAVTDDTFAITYQYFINGVASGSEVFTNANLDDNWDNHAGLAGTSLRYGPGQWIQRGAQGSAAEVYIDNIVLFLPEPASMGMIGMGLMAMGARRRR